ncbi:MAG: hypothetical protein AB7R77_26295 [Ilumatobacteraceae bacterium]
MSGFTTAQIAGIQQREGNICAMSGALIAGRRLPRHPSETANHRLNRGIGGDPSLNGTDNGCAICHTCNGLIESDPDYAAAARHRGVKLVSGERPELVAMWCVFFTQWVQLVGDMMLLTGERDETTRPAVPDPNELDIGL